MNNVKNLAETTVDQEAVNYLQDWFMGFVWKQSVMMIAFQPYNTPRWEGRRIQANNEVESNPSYYVDVMRSGVSSMPTTTVKPAPVAPIPTQNKTAEPGAIAAPVAPQKSTTTVVPPAAAQVYAKYEVRVLKSEVDPTVMKYKKRPIFQSKFDGLEEGNSPLGLREYLLSKFGIPVNIVKPIVGKGWNIRMAQQNQNFGNWYQGQLPDAKKLEQYVGTPNVDASQISSAFGGVNKAVSMVNQFNGSLLRSIAFVFNTAGSAYGVYVPALDQAINNEKTKNLLKEKGCIIQDLPNGAFSAQPKDPSKISPDQIQSEINRIEGEMKTQGGHAFGINMNKVLESARADEAQLKQKTSRDFEFLGILHLGETMAHEATHAKGHQDEGAPMASQQSFVQWALPKLDAERKQVWMAENKGATEDQYVPMAINSGMRHANWYQKLLTKLSYADKGYSGGGSLQGRYTKKNESKSAPKREGTVPSWAGMFWKGPHSAIENMLQQPDSGFSNKDSIEKRMRLERRKSSQPKLDPHALTSELIDADRKPTEAYNSTEKLLEDQRPKAMILSEDQSLKKQAYTDGVDASEPGYENAGWMQNLKLDQRERMKTGVEVDDDLSTNQDETIHNDRVKGIKENPRYNPEYPEEGGCRGIFHSFWYEPRFEPERWDQMADERTRTSPSSRFANNSMMDHYRELADFLSKAMEVAKESIQNKDFKATRFLVSPNLATAIQEAFQGDQDIQVIACSASGRYVPVWITDKTVTEDQIQQSEKFVLGEDCGEQTSAVFDEITNLSAIKEKTITEILEAAKEICLSNGLTGVYAVGGFPRSLAMKEKYIEIRDLDFSSSYPDECLKLGGMLAEKLGVKNPEFYHRTMTMTWNHQGIKCDFRGKEISMVDRQLLRDNQTPTTALNLDIFSRDLTINMLIYNLSDSKIYDVTKQAAQDIQRKILRTYFPAGKVVPGNPLIILRTLKYACRYDGFTIDTELQKAMLANIDKLATLGEERIAQGISDVLREGKVKGESLLKEYGIELTEYRIK